MSSPVRALIEIAHSKQKGELAGFTLFDTIMLNVTLGLFEKKEINIAVLNVIDDETQVPIRFNAESGIALWDPIKDGRMFLYFDDYQLLGLITKTVRRKFFFMHQFIYQAYLATPIAPILIGKPTIDFDTALGWLEMRYMKYVEIFPTLNNPENPDSSVV